ncbi:NAD-dependent epimerase/dehydratase family protein [Micromonosporaceae bacterium Da 78-11]
MLVVGASGFIGSHVVAALRGRSDVRLRLLRHVAPVATGEAIETVTGRLTAPDSLQAACSDVDVVLHCASRVEGPDDAVETVNDRGTRALVEAATDAGAHRLVYVSTTAVYGRGPFTAARPGDVCMAPRSVVSRSRGAGERHVLDAGGVVLRPHLVHGRGDRWVVPGLVRLLRELSAGLTGCPARHSLVDVRSLGRAAVAAALSPRASGVYHVGPPKPVSTAELLFIVERALRLDLGERIDVRAALDRVSGSSMAAHHLKMLAVDHWFADDRIRRDLGWQPTMEFSAVFRWHLPWYRRLLAAPVAVS